MKITVITPSYLPVMGGMQNVVFHLIEEWKKKGHAVEIIAGRTHRKLASRESFGDVLVRRFFFAFGPPPLRPLPWAKYIALTLSSPITLLLMWRCLRRHKPDFIHVHLHLRSDLLPTLCILRAMLGRIPWFATVHGMDLHYEGSGRLERALACFFLIRCLKVTAVSRYLCEQIARVYPRLRGRLMPIPNGFGPERFAEARPYQHQNPYLLCIGRMTDQVKGQDVLLEAFRGISHNARDLDLILAGDGPTRPSLDRKVQDMGLNARVVFFGAANAQEVASLLTGCRLLVIPSLYEPFGLVCLEGMAAGKPIVACRVGGIPEVLDGYPMAKFVSAGSVEELREGILHALSQWAGDSPKKIAGPCMDRFLWPSIAQNYLEAFGA